MTKRARGTSRPGQRRPLQRPTGSRPARSPEREPAGSPDPRPPSTLTPDEEARAAELEARIVAEERAAEEAARRTRERTRRATEGDGPAVVAGRGGSSLAVRAADEYQYVIRDLRRIAILCVSLTGFLFAAWIVLQVMG
jgi:hypothetical protein